MDWKEVAKTLANRASHHMDRFNAEQNSPTVLLRHAIAADVLNGLAIAIAVGLTTEKPNETP